MVYIDTGSVFASKRKIVSFMPAWIMLKDIMLSENKPDTKDVYHTCFNSHVESKVIDVIGIDTGLWFPGAG